MFLNNRQYASDYENLIKKSFRKEINNYSFLKNILETFSINSFINYFNKFKKLIFKDKENDEIILADSTTKNKINYFLGDERDVLSRYYKAAKKLKAKKIIRLTADCPLIDFRLVDRLIKLFKQIMG